MPHSVPGESARGIADGADAAAAALARKSEYARRRAGDFRQGAEGELETARALAGLTLNGWVVLHDRLAPTGGNIDHIAVGPGGVVVIDSKSWSGTVSITESGELRVAGRSKSREVAGLVASAATVAHAIEATGHSVPVTAVLSLTQEGPQCGPRRLPQGPLIVGVSDLVAELQSLPERVRPTQADAVVSIVLSGFPPADRTVQEALHVATTERGAAGELFLRGNVFLYVEPWSRSGFRRLYLNDTTGTSLGYKDLLSGGVTVSDQGQADVVRGVLRHAHTGGLALSRSELPKIPVKIPGGRILGHIGRLWSNFLVAQHWRKGPKDRLYVTHAVMDQGIFELGHIDLGTGMLYPASNEPLGKDLREPVRYLELAAERYPGINR
jgi:hypothetical protein